jgi:hypothetical protein
MRPEGLLRFLEQGRYLTLFDLLRSSGNTRALNALGRRALLESRMFSTCSPLVHDTAGRPRYGYLCDQGAPLSVRETNTTFYGSADVLLEPAVLDITSHTYGDSWGVNWEDDNLNQPQPRVAPSMVLSPHWTSFDFRSPSHPFEMYVLADYIDPRSLGADGPVHEYVEAQYHLVLEPADIRAVVFTEPFASEEEDLWASLQEALQAADIPYEVELHNGLSQDAVNLPQPAPPGEVS